MLKEGKLYYTIGEVAEMLELSTSNIRYWESEIPSLKPQKYQMGKRAYVDNEINALRLVKYLLRDKKMTIDGVKLYLKDRKHTFMEYTNRVNVIDELIKIKGEISEIRHELNFFVEDKQ